MPRFNRKDFEELPYSWEDISGELPSPGEAVPEDTLRKLSIGTPNNFIIAMTSSNYYYIPAVGDSSVYAVDIYREDPRDTSGGGFINKDHYEWIRLPDGRLVRTGPHHRETPEHWLKSLPPHVAIIKHNSQNDPLKLCDKTHLTNIILSRSGV